MVSGPVDVFVEIRGSTGDLLYCQCVSSIISPSWCDSLEATET